MFGPRLTRVFASRNNALWWSAMVLITAYCVAADPPAKVDGNLEVLSEKQAPRASDPWSDSKPAN